MCAKSIVVVVCTVQSIGSGRALIVQGNGTVVGSDTGKLVK